MTLDTLRLQLQPFNPEHLLALLEGEKNLEEMAGLFPAAGLREFLGRTTSLRRGLPSFVRLVRQIPGSTASPSCTGRAVR